MEDIFLHLEARIQFLLRQCEELKQINIRLRNSKTQLIRDKEILLSKHKVAIAQIETMVSRLKSIEKTQ